MTIKDLRESDSAEYKFRLLTTNDGRFSDHPGVILNVTDVRLEMVPSSVSEGGRLTLLCKTRCTLDHIPEYIWYKNGRVTQPVTSSNRLIPDQETSSNRLIRDPVSREDAGRYSCGVKGSVDLNSTEETITIMYAPKNTSVSVSPSGEIMEGSSVTLTCSSDANPPVDKYTWYKKTVTSPKASGQSYSITNIRSEDNGEYYCEAQNEYVRLNSSFVSVDVQYGPKNISVSVSPSGKIVEGSSVTLTCSSDANPPVDKYTWYKKTVTSPKASGQSYSITNVRSEDSGEYYCEAENKYGRLNSSSVSVDIQLKQSLVSGVVGITVVVLVLILCLSGFIWFRKKSSQSTSDEGNIRDTQNNGQTDSSPVYDNISDMVMTSTAAQTADTDNQDDLHYASVYYSSSNEQEEPLYSTIQLSQPQKQEEEVQYAALKFNCPSAATRLTTREAEEEPSMLYNTVNNPRNKRT
uniref:Ig-like domain-containing protein n=1 Tax=Esox lucius TaxID=8010 RepID=A0AAY5L4R5_ESOLU